MIRLEPNSPIKIQQSRREKIPRIRERIRELGGIATPRETCFEHRPQRRTLEDRFRTFQAMAALHRGEWIGEPSTETPFRIYKRFERAAGIEYRHDGELWRPVLRGRLVDGGRVLIVRCPFCRETRRHGWIEDPETTRARGSHCTPGCPTRDTGIFIALKTPSDAPPLAETRKIGEIDERNKL